MASEKTENENGNPIGKGRKDQATKLIEGSLRTFYDGIMEQGTPERLIDLLEKLDAAEKAAAEKKK
ncbi:NepR family anti-sigma factor [Rhizobium sp. PAMB 3182]